MQLRVYLLRAGHPAAVDRPRTTRVGFLISAMSLAAAGAMLWNALRSDRTGERHWHIIPACLLIAAGFLLCGLSNAPLPVIAGIATITISYSAMQGPLLAIPATFLAGRSQAAGIAALNMIGILGGFIGPYWMGFARDLTGNYQRGLLTFTLPMLAAAAIMLHLRRRATGAARGKTAPEPVASLP